MRASRPSARLRQQDENTDSNVNSSRAAAAAAGKATATATASNLASTKSNGTHLGTLKGGAKRTILGDHDVKATKGLQNQSTTGVAKRDALAPKASHSDLRNVTRPIAHARSQSGSDTASVVLTQPLVPRTQSNGSHKRALEVLADANGPVESTKNFRMNVVMESEEAVSTGEGMTQSKIALPEPQTMSMDPIHLSDSDGEPLTDDESEDDESLDAMNGLVLTQSAEKAERSKVEKIRQGFVEELEFDDTTMVAEYSEEIFRYLSELEVTMMPNADYMDHQQDLDWNMRVVLIDWLASVHLRYHMLPETLWIAVNIIDRFLSVRVVSRPKLQLVGVTALFIAAKYEEIMAPSVDEMCYVCDQSFTRDELLKGERIILQTLNFNLAYPTPFSFLRRVSKGDDYDLQTRTLAKYIMDVSLTECRMLSVKSSQVAATSMFLARKMLSNGDWNDAMVYYSGYTENQLAGPAQILLEHLATWGSCADNWMFKKYMSKRFMRASTFVKDWVKNRWNGGRL